GELVSGQLAMLSLPAVQELGQRLDPQPGRGRLGQPARQTPTTALGRRPHRITQIGVERNTELVDFHALIIPRCDVPRYEPSIGRRHSEPLAVPLPLWSAAGRSMP